MPGRQRRFLVLGQEAAGLALVVQAAQVAPAAFPRCRTALLAQSGLSAQLAEQLVLPLLLAALAPWRPAP